MPDPRRLIDWAAIQALPADLAGKLNAAFFSAETRVRELRALDAELEELIEQLQADVALPAVGPGAGTYGGGGDFVESVTLDTEGRTAALTVARPASTVGSIFSMVGPAGAADPVVAYDFTQYDPAASDADNLEAANQSGDSDYDLTAVGTAKIKYLAQAAVGTIQTPFAWTPLACSSDGGALTTGHQANYVVSSGSPAGLQILSGLTVEWLGYVSQSPGAGEDMYLWDFSAVGGTEAANILYLLRWAGASTGDWDYQHEDGPGNLSVKGFFSHALARLGDLMFNPAHIVLTRAPSTGLLNLYINGRKCSTAAAAATPLPTGGTTSDLSIGYGAANSTAEVLGVRIFDVELTAAQVRASHQRTFFGVST